VNEGGANAAAVVVAELLEGAGLAPPNSLQLGTLRQGAAWLGFTHLTVKVRAEHEILVLAGAAARGTQAAGAAPAPCGARARDPRRTARSPAAAMRPTRR
jgi:hypothetical protein